MPPTALQENRFFQLCCRSDMLHAGLNPAAAVWVYQRMSKHLLPDLMSCSHFPFLAFFSLVICIMKHFQLQPRVLILWKLQDIIISLTMWHHWGPQHSPSTPAVGKFKPAQLRAARLITSWACCHVKCDPCKMTIWPFIIHKSWGPVADQWVGAVKRQTQPLSGWVWWAVWTGSF